MAKRIVIPMVSESDTCAKALYRKHFIFSAIQTPIISINILTKLTKKRADCFRTDPPLIRFL